jgi:hypothetical protein
MSVIPNARVPCGLAQSADPGEDGSCPDASSTPSLFFKKPGSSARKKRQSILELIGGSASGITLKELAIAVNSNTNCVSVMMHQINKELVEQGWKIISSDLVPRLGHRGATRRCYRLVRL